jgi:ribosomal-protein-alanine N-acetyltransferase
MGEGANGSVRALRATDAPACHQLDEAALGGLWSLAQWQRELSEPGRICLGLIENHGLIALACGWLVVDELHITAVAVTPEQRRRGHGRQLLVALMEQGRAAGARHATLEVASHNRAAVSLYQDCGFQTAGCRRNYYSDGGDALIQWCRLGSSG